MSGAVAEPGVATGLYVYGVVSADSEAGVVGEAQGVDPSQPIALVAEGELAAIASAVLLEEFGEAGLEANLRDEAWLEEKARAHEAVLEAALGRTPLVPFRFGTIYLGEAQVRQMLQEQRVLVATLERLAGKVELGVKAVLDADVFEYRYAGAFDEHSGSGRAYMLRKQRERWLAERRARFAADCAAICHEHLTAAAEAGRANVLRRLEYVEPVLNGAYLVATEAEAVFAAQVAALASRYAVDGVRFEVTGPWPPYNFVDEDEQL